ncbi:MAG: tyrosine-protein phosphatase [Mogibacterium sp.]|nr:tyrosine-protein phosphatase [Mogibacterium sp.]
MRRIIFEKLNNTRDLGGIETKDGSAIVRGKLIRSGRLGIGSEEDIERIGKMVSAVVDFRSDNERTETPDPEMPGVENIHIPIIDDLAAGVSRDQKSDREAFMMLANDPEGSMQYMCRTYEGFVTSDSARRGYRQFVDLLLEGRDNAVLWHCTAGKDRAGFATVIVLEMLGVDRETIIQNYLRTNDLIEDDINGMVGMFFKVTGSGDQNTERALRYMFSARREYIDAAYASIERNYGSFREFLIDGLGLTEEDISKMREMYLEHGTPCSNCE